MTRGFDGRQSQSALSNPASATSQVALSDDEVAISVQALKAKLFDAISEHCTTREIIWESTKQHVLTGPMTGIVTKASKDFWSAHDSTNASYTSEAALEANAVPRAGKARLDFTLNTMALKHATHVIGKALDEVPSDLSGIETRYDKKTLQAKCDRSISEALNQFHHDSHIFAGVENYHAKAEKYGRPDIFTCQDMISDENTLRQEARMRYIDNRGAEVEDGDLDYHWVAGIGSWLRCTQKFLMPKTRVGPSWRGYWTPEEKPEDEGIEGGTNSDLLKAIRTQSIQSRADQLNPDDLLATIRKLDDVSLSQVDEQPRASSEGDRTSISDSSADPLSTELENLDDALGKISSEPDKADGP